MWFNESSQPNARCYNNLRRTYICERSRVTPQQLLLLRNVSAGRRWYLDDTPTVGDVDRGGSCSCHDSAGKRSRARVWTRTEMLSCALPRKTPLFGGTSVKSRPTATFTNDSSASRPFVGSLRSSHQKRTESFRHVVCYKISRCQREVPTWAFASSSANGISSGVQHDFSRSTRDISRRRFR